MDYLSTCCEGVNMTHTWLTSLCIWDLLVLSRSVCSFHSVRARLWAEWGHLCSSFCFRCPLNPKGFLICLFYALCLQHAFVAMQSNGLLMGQRSGREGRQRVHQAKTFLSLRETKKSATFQITIHPVDAHLAFKGDDWFNWCSAQNMPINN